MMRAGKTNRRKHARILIYCHDTFGLGHLRRCQAIAHSLVERNKDMTVLILCGSPIIGRFDFRSRVDFVRIPGVIKLRNGEYTSLSLHIDIEETLAMRASIIRHTAEIFDPDVFIVDKEPLGLRGEVVDTLEMLKGRGTPLVLGLRDIMDEPALLQPEWQRKNVVPALTKYYDHIWVYGLPQICNPLAGIDVPDSVRHKLIYTGYLERTALNDPPHQSPAMQIEDPFILVTPGGGGDGETMVDWVLRAYEADSNMPNRALIVLGPFMQSKRQADFMARAEALPNVDAITFDSHLERLIERAVGIVAMGGYNTFCEILSFDKRALIVPRTIPRREQYLRASRAQEIGLVRMLGDDGECTTEDMITALLDLPQQQKPSDSIVPGILDGLENVNRLVHQLLRKRRQATPRLAESRG